MIKKQNIDYQENEAETIKNDPSIFKKNEM